MTVTVTEQTFYYWEYDPAAKKMVQKSYKKTIFDGRNSSGTYNNPEHISATSKGDIIRAGDHQYVFAGGGDDDITLGNFAHDNLVLAGPGNDYVEVRGVKNNGRERTSRYAPYDPLIYGGSGKDTIKADWLGHGFGIAYGGSGSDTFIVGWSSEGKIDHKFANTSFIMDFNKSSDHLVLSARDSNEFNDWRTERMTISYEGKRYSGIGIVDRNSNTNSSSEQVIAFINGYNSFDTTSSYSTVDIIFG